MSVREHNRYAFVQNNQGDIPHAVNAVCMNPDCPLELEKVERQVLTDTDQTFCLECGLPQFHTTEEEGSGG